MFKTKKVFIDFSFINLLVALVVFISFNIIIAKVVINKKIDFTSDKLFTLSKNTKSIVQDLNEQIKIKLFFSETLSKEIPQIRDYERRVRELLLAYSDLSKNIKLEIIDPKPFTDLEDLATTYGIQGLQLNQEGEKFYFGTILTNSVDDMVVIPYFDISRERFLEYDLTKSIHNLANTEKPVIGLISGLPFAGGLSSRKGEPSYQKPFYLYQNIQEFYEIIDLTNSLDKIDNNIDQLLIIHPKSLSDKTLYEIEQFVLKGKGATFFIDPFSEFEKTNNDPSLDVSSIPKSDLNKMFKKWGFSIEPGMIVGDIINGRKVSLGRPGDEKILTYILWLALQGELLSKEDIITENLDYLFFKSAGAIKNLNINKNITLTPLVSTSINSMLVERFKIQLRAEPEALLKDFKSANTSHILGARIKGNFESSYSVSDLKAMGIDTKKHIYNNNSNIIVFSDTDLLVNDAWLSNQQMFGRENIIPIADNGRLVMNAIESMSGGKNLIGLRGRGISNRPFLVVENLQKEAELLLIEKEISLKKELEETESKLNKLKDENFSANDSLTYEQTETINEFNKKIFKIRKDLREVQRELGENIKSLETTLKLFNIWLMPFLVLLIYFIFKFITVKNNKKYLTKKDG